MDTIEQQNKTRKEKVITGLLNKKDYNQKDIANLYMQFYSEETGLKLIDDVKTLGAIWYSKNRTIFYSDEVNGGCVIHYCIAGEIVRGEKKPPKYCFLFKYSPYGKTKNERKQEKKMRERFYSASVLDELTDEEYDKMIEIYVEMRFFDSAGMKDKSKEWEQMENKLSEIDSRLCYDTIQYEIDKFGYK